MLDITNKEDYINGSVHKNLIIELEDGSIISNKNILKESMSLDEILMEDNQLRFGRCNASEFSITLATVASNIKNEKIKVYIESNDSRLQLGEFTVNFVEKSADKSFKQITALDNMQNIDKDVTEWYKTLSFPMTQKAFRDSFFSYVGLEQVDVALPFDNLTVNDPFGNMVSINGRIIAEGICELNARFGHCNREGKFEYIQLNSSGNEILDINKKYINCSYDDFVTQTIDRVIIIDEYGTQVSNNNNGNNAYVINNNFMLYGRTVDELRTLGNQFLEFVKDVEYTPFTMENRGLPYVQLGDSIHATTNNGEFNSFIFRRTLRGIQALRDIYSAEGEEYLISDLNSIQQKIDEANRNTERTRIELTTSIEGLKSTVTSIETTANNANTVANQANTKADEALDNVNISSKATGNYITVEDSGAYPLIELYGYGKSEQKSYTGKNLLQNNLVDNTNNGIAYKRNMDGSVTINGATGDTNSTGYLNTTLSLPVGEYILSGGYNENINVVFVTASSVDGTKWHTNTGSDINFNIDENVTSINVYIQVKKNQTVNNLTIYPMVRKASITDATYEPYVGGEASPNPSYPQHVYSVADKSKNLLESTATSTTTNGVTFTVNSDGYVTANGTATADTNFVINSAQELSNGTYIISGCPSGGAIETYSLNVRSITNDTGYGAEFTLTETQSVTVQIIITSGQTVNYLTFYPMIRNAKIDDDTYEPYHNANDLVVKSTNKNLLELVNTSQTFYGITTIVNTDDGTVTLNGTATGDFTHRISAVTPDLPDGDLIMSGCPSGGSSSTYSMQYSNNVDKAYVDFGDSVHINKFDYKKYPKTCVLIKIKSGTVFDNVVFKPMIRLASIDDNTYEPYQSTASTITLTDSLRGIPVSEGGNYTDESGQQWICDTIEKYVDGSGKLAQRVGAYTFTGKENWTHTSTWNNNSCFGGINILNDIVKVSGYTTLANIKSTHFVTKAPNNLSGTNVDGIGQGGENGIYISVYSLGITTVEDFKTWLSNNNVTMFYPLAEPIETPLTAEQVAEIEKLQTFNHVTHVTTDDIGDIAIQYYKNNANADVVAQGNQNVLAKAQSSITQTADDIKLEVSKTYSTTEKTTEIDNRLKKAESSITQNATNIELKVSSDEIISTINQSAEEIQIQADKLKLEGYTSINNGLQVLEDGSVLLTRARLLINTPNDTDSTITLNRVLYDGDEVITKLLPQYIQFERYETDGSSRVGTLGSVILFLTNSKPSGTNEIVDNLEINALDKEILCITYNRNANGDVLSETVHYQINDNLAFFRPSVRTEGELQSTSQYAFRSVYGDYGFMIFNPGGQTYFLLTNSGDQYGSFNSLRPLTINNSTGLVTMENGLQLGTSGTAIRFIVCGSTVVTPSGTSTQVVSLATLQSWYSGATEHNTTMLVSNGDATTNSIHIDGASYVREGSPGWYATYNASASGYLRINYTIICWA